MPLGLRAMISHKNNRPFVLQDWAVILTIQLRANRLSVAPSYISILTPNRFHVKQIFYFQSFLRAARSAIRIPLVALQIFLFCYVHLDFRTCVWYNNFGATLFGRRLAFSARVIACVYIEIRFRKSYEEVCAYAYNGTFYSHYQLMFNLLCSWLCRWF